MRRVGASLVLAGGAACAYHSTEPSGKRVWLRSAFRKLDHWTVSLASAALVCAAGSEVGFRAQRDSCTCALHVRLFGSHIVSDASAIM